MCVIRVQNARTPEEQNIILFNMKDVGFTHLLKHNFRDSLLKSGRYCSECFFQNLKFKTLLLWQLVRKLFFPVSQFLWRQLQANIFEVHGIFGGCKVTKSKSDDIKIWQVLNTRYHGGNDTACGILLSQWISLPFWYFFVFPSRTTWGLTRLFANWWQTLLSLKVQKKEVKFNNLIMPVIVSAFVVSFQRMIAPGPESKHRDNEKVHCPLSSRWYSQCVAIFIGWKQILLCLKCVLFIIINKVDTTLFIIAVKEPWRQEKGGCMCYVITEGSILSPCNINV